MDFRGRIDRIKNHWIENNLTIIFRARSFLFVRPSLAKWYRCIYKYLGILKILSHPGIDLLHEFIRRYRVWNAQMCDGRSRQKNLCLVQRDRGKKSVCVNVAFNLMRHERWCVGVMAIMFVSDNVVSCLSCLFIYNLYFLIYIYITFRKLMVLEEINAIYG